MATFAEIPVIPEGNTGLLLLGGLAAFLAMVLGMAVYAKGRDEERRGNDPPDD